MPYIYIFYAIAIQKWLCRCIDIMYSDAVCVCVLTARVAEEEDGGDSDSSSEDEKGATISESNGGERR